MLLPNLCPGCLATVAAAAGQVCADCRGSLNELPLPRCAACGGAVDGVLAVCGECLAGGPRPWRQAVSVYGYGGYVRDLVHRFKYRGAVYLAPFFAGAMAAAWRRHGLGRPELIVPVPMHWWRELWRGYNQAALLGHELGRLWGVPVRRALGRARWSRRQVELGREQRQKNLRRVFGVRRPAELAGKCVLLVDDVFTTGATLATAAGAVLDCKPSTVDVLTLARG